jgi:hypothetical protein
MDTESALLDLPCSVDKNELKTIFNENDINNMIVSYENDNNKINEEEKTILKMFYTTRLLLSKIQKKDTNEIIKDLLIQMTNSPFPLKNNNIELLKSNIHGN